MRQRTRALLRHGLIWGAVGAALAASISALAQITPRQLDPNQRQVVLVRQDTSDCSGSNVPNVDSPLVGGTLWATQLFDGNTSVKIAMTTRPNTTYRISLKCVRPLGDLTTDDEGVANVRLPSRPAWSARSIRSSCRPGTRPAASTRARRSSFSSAGRRCE